MAEGEGSSAVSPRWDNAFDAVGHWFADQGVAADRLGANAAALYPGHTHIDGWRIALEFPSGVRLVDILVGSNFPFAPPRIALVDPPPPLTWPHMETEGHLCLLPNGTPVSADDPVGVVVDLLDGALRLVEASEAGANVDDFRSEFLSYWPVDLDADDIFSLVEPRGPSRTVAAFPRKTNVVIAEDEAALGKWLRHTKLAPDDKKFDFERALLIWLEQPLLPAEYPDSTDDILRLAEQAGQKAALEALASQQPSSLLVVFGAPTENGPVLAGVILKHRRSAGPGRPRDATQRGFRPGHVPPAILAKRHIGAAKSVKTSVDRIDASWVHGRDCDPDLKTLRALSVVMIGCGSLGGPVALALAQAGVGTLDLIDPDRLAPANVGRHPLGMSEVGAYKVTALAHRIKIDYPHIGGVRSSATRWETVAAAEPDRLLNADLVISTMGEWSAEGLLNAWRQTQKHRPDTLFGWTEPFAVAGHGIGLVQGEGCLGCGLTRWGDPLLPVADWPDGTGRRGEPACGVMFQPYGPVEAAHVVAIIAEAAIDILLERVTEPFHRIWVGRQAVLDQAGGVWSEAWLEANGGDPRAASLVERQWPSLRDCNSCAMTPA